MKRALILLPALLLASCSPILSRVEGTASTLKFTTAGLTFFNGDSSAALKVVVALDGATSDPRCEAPREGIRVCRLGDVPANTAAPVIALSGPLGDANATWRTPAGKLRAIVANK